MKSMRGNIYVISGFSGSGKGTIMEKFRDMEGYFLSVSCTSRSRREGEKEGVSYYYISHEEFLKRAEEGYFLEHAVYADHGYGTPAGPVEEHLCAGDDVLLEIELQGAMQIKKKYPDAVLIFIAPPSIDELTERLRKRNSEDTDEIRKRMSQAVVEAEDMDRYDYILVNDVVEKCFGQLKAVMLAERLRAAKNTELIARLKEDLKDFA